MEIKTLYHLTNKEYLKAIRKEGLKPMLGKNSECAMETSPRIYLCDRKNVAHWAIILGLDEVLRIRYDFAEDELEEYQHSTTKEYVYASTIPPAYIKKDVSMLTEKSRRKAMEDLCRDYIYGLSEICTCYARYYTDDEKDSYMDPELHDWLMSVTRATIAIMKNLNYEVLSTKEMKTILREMGEDGNYTYDDTYLDTKHRLYQMLIRYPSDDLEAYRKTLYKLMKKKLRGTFRVNTGGW